MNRMRQGIRVYTREIDGNRSINALAREQLAPVLGAPTAAPQVLQQPRRIQLINAVELCVLMVECKGILSVPD
jgi:hypothetical protein